MPMRRQGEVAALERLLSAPSCSPELREVDPDAEPTALDRRRDQERRAIFHGRAIIVGRESELPLPGSFFTHDASGAPLLVTRDRWGKVHAMLNLCRHRGTRLVFAEQGSASAFVCVYHAWTYDLCGRLGLVQLGPCSRERPRDESSLVERPCETRHGFVWVVPTGGAPEGQGGLAHLDDELSALRLGERVVLRRSTTTRAVDWPLVEEAFARDEEVGTRLDLVELRTTLDDEWHEHDAVITLSPNSLLLFDATTVSHVAVFPHSTGVVTCARTVLAAL